MRVIKQPGEYLYVFDPKKESISTVQNGETICISTRDAFCDKLNTPGMLPSDLSGDLNPVTGPLFIEDAMPGDTASMTTRTKTPTTAATATAAKHCAPALAMWMCRFPGTGRGNLSPRC